MEFKDFKALFQQNFVEMVADTQHLFEVEVDKDELWNLYLDSFPAGTNEVYRERREYDCSCCRHFIKSIGNVVSIKNNVIRTMWDFQTNDSTFQPVVNALSHYLKNKAVCDVYTSKFDSVGTDANRELGDAGKIITWEHFYLKIPSKFVDRSSRSIAEIQAGYRDTRNVFQRSLEEITIDSINTVLELTAQNSLYKGEEWKSVLLDFRKYKKEYDELCVDARENYCWEKSVIAGPVIGRIRNHSIGTLLVNISEDMDLDQAVRKYEAIVAPTNYKRPKAIFTQKMLEDAKKTITDLGYMDSLQRRFATLDDITVNNILFSNHDSAKRIDGADVFSELASGTAANTKQFSRVEEIGAEQFVKEVLPTAREVEAFVENRHAQNMVSLIAPAIPGSKSMFKWDNAFGWAYSGNITDSDIRDNVKNAGGSVTGVLRFSIQWNDEDYNPNDFDAHCIEPGGNEIYYRHKQNYSTGGCLDVDIIHPIRNSAAVENITWPNRTQMERGKYRFFVNCYSNNGGRSGFKAEIEFDGQTYAFNYNNELRQGENVQVAEVTIGSDGKFGIKEMLPSTTSSKTVWGVKTFTFDPVSVVMYSPNYWDEQDGVGNRHYFFMLKNAVNDEEPNGFYNEFLKQDLAQHKHVLEALGAKLHIVGAEDQLSGLGFSSTKRNDLVVKVKGITERILRIKF